MAFKIITYRGWKRFWGRAFGWFSSQFDSIRTALNGLDVDVDLSPVAKEATVAKDATVAKEAAATANKEAIISAINSAQPDLSSVAKDSTVAKESTLNAVLALLQGDDAPEELPEGVGDRLLLLLQHFGIAGSYEAEAKGGERTNNTVIDECKVRFQDAFNGLLPTGFTMPNSVTVDNLTYTGTTNS